ncbi:MAG TPA: MarC family protein [Candidatus Nitrosopolaris sp.]|nr:MarC family protein [Candidatus Nitrosopolaris sp.]
MSIFGVALLLVITLSLTNDALAESQWPEDKGVIINTRINVHGFENLYSNIQQALVHFTTAITNIVQALFSVQNTVGYDTLRSTIALFVVIDPIGTVPLFIALTEKMGREEKKAISKTAIITSGILLVVFAVAGTQILTIFGITIFSFMIAGGILLFIVAIELLTHGIWRFGASGGSLTAGESGVVPLAFPLLAGPGAITSVIISFQTAGLIVTVLSIAIVIGITYGVLRSINPIYRLLGRRGTMIITRVFAVFIAAIAVQYIIEGVKRLFI